MPTRVTAPPLRIPEVSYGPLRLLEAVPWLMLAAAMRTLMSPASMVVASLCLLLAFLLVARRMIEFSDGRTDLGRLGFGDQIRLAGRIFLRVLALLVAAVASTYALGAGLGSLYWLMGLDGVAFDNPGRLGKVWSCILAVIVLLMVVEAGQNRPVTLTAALGELLRRALWLVPAVVVATSMQFILSYIQGSIRWPLLLWWKTAADPQLFKNLVYFFFIFVFATVRLWATLAILTFALRESYRCGDA
jgi:hypothetical protein